MLKPLAVAASSLLLFATGAHGRVPLPTHLSGPSVIRVTQRQQSNRIVGVHTAQVSIIHDRHGRRIGWSIIYCTYLGSGGALGSGTSQCIATFELPLGKIQATGTRKTSASYVLAVTGGTGLYNAVGGTLLIRNGFFGPYQILLFSLESN